MTIVDPYTGTGTFHKAQLHVHTRRSDGRMEPEEVLARYRDAGFTFVALTDHDRLTTCDVFDGPDFLAIPGVEETLVRGIYPLGPHLGRLFVEHRLGRGSAQERLDATRREGGVAVLNHPSWKGNLWTAEWTLEAMRRLRGPLLLEIVNPHSHPAEDLRRWTALLAARPRAETVGAVAGDDAHRPAHIGRGWIMVKVSAVTAAALRGALEGLAFYATTGPQAEMGTGDGAIRCAGDLAAVTFLDRQGRVRGAVEGGEGSYRPVGDEGFVRIEGRGRAGGRIWSQPFWIESEEDGAR